MKSARAYYLVWLAAVYDFSFGPNVPFVAAEDDISHEDDGEQVYHPDEPAAYDPADENPENVCRRNPTWRRKDLGNDVLLDYETCRELVGWKPRDIWWREDPHPAARWLSDGKEQQIADCLDEAMRNVDGTLWWAR